MTGQVTLICVIILVNGQRAFGGLYNDSTEAKKFCDTMVHRMMPDTPTFALVTVVQDESKKRFPNDLVTYVPSTSHPVEDYFPN